MLFIPKPISILGAAINKVGFPSMGPNNANIGKSGEKNAIVVYSTVKNKGIGESNTDAKVGLEVQSNTAIIAPFYYWLITAMAILVSASYVFVSVCSQLTPVCNSRFLLSRV